MWTEHYERLFRAAFVSLPASAELASGHDYVHAIVDPERLCAPISSSEVLVAVSLSKNKKAAGLDGLTAEILKHHIASLLPHLHNLFSFCFSAACCPLQWCMTRLIPLYKSKGSKMDPNSYRGISLMSVVYKCFSSILHSRLSDWAEANNKLPDCQHGFRAGRSTISAIESLLNNVKLGVRTTGTYYVAFIDFQKAFDCVDRSLLLSKLCVLGVSYHFVRVLHSILENTSIKVSLGDYLSDSISQQKGVPQGDRLSPLLFSLFIADLPSDLLPSDCDLTLYADDLAIGSSYREDLQYALIRLSAYCEKNDLKVNVKKSEVMVFKNGGRSETEPFLFRNEPLTLVKSFIYLGVKLTPKLSCRAHLDRNLTCSKSHVAVLFSNNMLAKLNLAHALRLYHAIMLPKLLYGVSVFSNELDQSVFDAYLKKAAGFFFKLWAGLSQYYPTTRFLSNLFDNDYLEIARAFGHKRRRIAEFYSAGCHISICSTPNCFRLTEFCLCRLCNNTIADELHLLTCTYFSDVMATADRILSL